MNYNTESAKSEDVTSFKSIRTLKMRSWEATKRRYSKNEDETSINAFKIEIGVSEDLGD
jgi:hypothetical protein